MLLLEGGITNRNCRVNFGGSDYVSMRETTVGDVPVRPCG